MLCRSKPWLGAVALSLLSAAAWAGDRIEADALDFGSPVAQQTLDERRAGNGGLEINVQDLDARVRNNTAAFTVNGDNHISGHAFRDASGFPVAVQNSGNNVVIQNAFIINLDVK